MNLTLEQIISYLRITSVAVGIPAAILLMVAVALRIMNPPKQLKQRIKELAPPPPPPPPPEPEPIDLSDLKRVIRAYIPYEDEQTLARLFSKAEANVSPQWEISASPIAAKERSALI